MNNRAAGKPDSALKMQIPILGPRFLPPSYLHVHRRSVSPTIEPSIAYLKPLNVVHPLYFPEITACPNCDGKNVKWDSWNATGHREVQGISREETAIGYQLRCDDCKKLNGNNQSSFAATSFNFWKHKEHWEIPRELWILQFKACTNLPLQSSTHYSTGGIPHFTASGALTRDLYNMIIELRPSTTSAGLAERIKRQYYLFFKLSSNAVSDPSSLRRTSLTRIPRKEARVPSLLRSSQENQHSLPS